MILLVEDHPELRSGYAVFLRVKGLAVLPAGDGAQALAALRAHPEIRLVILDIGLPDMSGLAVLAAIRADPSLHRLPVIIQSAYLDREREAMQAGASAFVRKDGGNVDALSEAVRTQLALSA